MTITLTDAVFVGGTRQTAGTSLTLDAGVESDLVTRGLATYTASPPSPGGTLSAGWTRTPSIFRLRLTGTGTCVLDSRDSLGNITAAFATYTASGATDQIEFPYAGANAVEIRATLTGTITAEVI